MMQRREGDRASQTNHTDALDTVAALVSEALCNGAASHNVALPMPSACNLVVVDVVSWVLTAAWQPLHKSLNDYANGQHAAALA